MERTSTVAPPASPAVASPARVALTGFVSMGTAMGIGRFAFTPLLPLMQQAQGLSLANGTWLALVNYLGYLVGAIFGVVRPLHPGRAARTGLVAVALSTLGMALTHDFATWLVLRFVAGVASALVLFGVSGWALAQLAMLKRAELGGWVFSGVGTSIAVAGGVAFLAGTTTGDPVPAWAVLGVLATLVVLATWRPYRRDLPGHAAIDAPAPRMDRSAWVLTVCYGVMGFGYIVPATFLPAVARALIDDPAIFGWVWPVFGVAAAVSVILMATVLKHVAPRRLCAWGTLVMAFGVGLPVVAMSIPTLIVSATCVGGTFVLITLAGIQEARRIAAPAPARLVAGMTALFAFGQLAGPLLAHAGESAVTAMRLPSTVAAIALFVAGVVLLLERSGRQ